MGPTKAETEAHCFKRMLPSLKGNIKRFFLVSIPGMSISFDFMIHKRGFYDLQQGTLTEGEGSVQLTSSLKQLVL